MATPEGVVTGRASPSSSVRPLGPLRPLARPAGRAACARSVGPEQVCPDQPVSAAHAEGVEHPRTALPECGSDEEHRRPPGRRRRAPPAVVVRPQLLADNARAHGRRSPVLIERDRGPVGILRRELLGQGGPGQVNVRAIAEREAAPERAMDHPLHHGVARPDRPARFFIRVVQVRAARERSEESRPRTETSAAQAHLIPPATATPAFDFPRSIGSPV